MIIGCMFSGKSTELIRRIREAELIGYRVMKIVHAFELQRYKDGIVTHDLDKTDAIAIDTLQSLPSYEDYDVIFIEEAQFFPDLFQVVSDLVNMRGKVVHVCGLDGDYLARPFQEMMRLVPIADTVVKLSGKCAVCGDRSIFSKRMTCHPSREDKVVLIGGSDAYQSVCRQHFYT